LRVDVARFRPNRSQRRVRKAIGSSMRTEIASPGITRTKLDLYSRYHDFQENAKGWQPADDDIESYAQSFVEHTFPTEEWSYFYKDTLVGVGYVDRLPVGLSAIYFYYDPEFRDLSLGTWNVLCALEDARLHALPYVYLGYYVAGCGSLEYKANFAPNQTLGTDGSWSDFRP
jgi:arginine-tRNA-protein transferase